MRLACVCVHTPRPSTQNHVLGTPLDRGDFLELMFISLILIPKLLLRYANLEALLLGDGDIPKRELGNELVGLEI